MQVPLTTNPYRINTEYDISQGTGINKMTEAVSWI